MIGTFWNLCRACPSMPIADKHRSEYRSTYQWYEYTGPRQEVVKQAPQLTSPTWPEEKESKISSDIRGTLVNVDKKEEMKKLKEIVVEGSVQPEVNIKPNPIFENKEEEEVDSETIHIDSQARVPIKSLPRIRSRNDRRDYAPSRRSKSEGPPTDSRKSDHCPPYGYPSPDRNEPQELETDYVLINNLANEYEGETTNIGVNEPRSKTEYRLQFAWPKAKNNCDHQGEIKSTSSIRRSIFVATIGQEKPPVPVHRRRMQIITDKQEGIHELESMANQQKENFDNRGNKDGKNAVPSNERVKFHSEYRKNYRPFSQYDYISGKFLARDNSVAPSSNLSNAAWYGEVVELRKKAGQYKHRGWGTELVPQHLADVYNKQIALWEHVSRRSSLSALTLATTTQKPRALTKEEKSQENTKKFRLQECRGTPSTRKKIDREEETKSHLLKSHKDLPFKDGTGRIQSVSSSSGSPKKTRSYTNSPKRIHGLVPDVGHQENITKKKADEIDCNERITKLTVSEVERIIKSPPEPTRVKSPEQAMVKSPEPVNWTVPLDTGKTFTVTQNIPEGNTFHNQRPSNEQRLLSAYYHEPLIPINLNILNKRDSNMIDRSSDDTANASEENLDMNGPTNTTNYNKLPTSNINEQEQMWTGTIPLVDIKSIGKTMKLSTNNSTEKNDVSPTADSTLSVNDVSGTQTIIENIQNESAL